MSDELVDLLSDFLGIARQRQIRFGEYVVKQRNWNVDFTEGIISFGKDEYPVQLLGTESDSSGTWLWGFANPSGFQSHIIKDSEIAFELCKSARELADSEIGLTELVNGHNIASIASVSSKERKCYYRCPYTGGAAFVSVANVPEVVFAPIHPVEIIRVLSDLIAELPLIHKRLVKSLMGINCDKISEENNAFTGKCQGVDLLVSFDPATGNIESMNTKNR